MPFVTPKRRLAPSDWKARARGKTHFGARSAGRARHKFPSRATEQVPLESTQPTWNRRSPTEPDVTALPANPELATQLGKVQPSLASTPPRLALQHELHSYPLHEGASSCSAYLLVPSPHRSPARASLATVRDVLGQPATTHGCPRAANTHGCPRAVQSSILSGLNPSSATGDIPDTSIRCATGDIPDTSIQSATRDIPDSSIRCETRDIPDSSIRCATRDIPDSSIRCATGVQPVCNRRHP
jgi:hypothetical protein